MDTKIESGELRGELNPDVSADLAASPLLPVIKKVQKKAFELLSERRYGHSLRVAETALKMCKLYGEREDRGYLAGIGHDICKEIEAEKLVSISLRDGMPVCEIEKKIPSLLHGRAAAVLLKEDFGIEDEELLCSVAFHTFGDKNFGILGKIIYSADKIEPGRENISPEYLEHLFLLSLDMLTKEVLEECIDYVRKKGKPVAPQSLEFLEKLEQDIKQGRDF